MSACQPRHGAGQDVSPPKALQQAESDRHRCRTRDTPVPDGLVGLFSRVRATAAPDQRTIRPTSGLVPGASRTSTWQAERPALPGPDRDTPVPDGLVGLFSPMRATAAPDQRTISPTSGRVPGASRTSPLRRRSRPSGPHTLRSMDYRTLGNSGCAVSTLALGTMTFGAEADAAAAHAQLDTFIEAGGTLVDTADVYSAGASEEIIGRWLADRPQDVTDRVVLATKGRFPMADEPNGVGLSARHLTRALDASLQRLGVDAVDLYQAHAFDPHTPLEETLRTFDGFIRAGKIRYYGLSNFTGWQLTKAVQLARAMNLAEPITLQPQYNLLVREIEWEIVPAALDADLGLLPWSPLGGGWLSGKYRRNERPTGSTRLGEDPGRGMEAFGKRNQLQRTWDVIEAVQLIAEGRGVSMAQVALAWVTNRPAVTSTILGARTLDQLTDNLKSAGLRLQVDELDALDTASRLPVGDYPYGELGVEQRQRRLSGGRG